jgi:molybdopterin/thiamine biosynthesis adenylyltransferase
MPDFPTISDAERYSRQVLFPGIGGDGQQKLRAGHAAIVGVGATGAATASLLARAGVGKLTLIDRDFVEPSNLQRQILFDEADAHAALPKAEAARRHIAAFNSGITVNAHVADLVPANIAALLTSSDIVLDCTDNFETRYLINDFCVQQGKPWIYAAAIGAYAATMNILPVTNLSSRPERSEVERSQHLQNSTLSPELSSRPKSADFADAAERPAVPAPTACLACLFPASPSGPVETCDTAGILSTAVNFAASIQATEALKFLTGNAGQMRRTLLSYDLWSNTHSEVSAATADPDCDVCAHRNFRYLSGAGRPHITLCGRNSVQIHEHARPIDLAALAAKLTPLGPVRANGLLLRFDRPPHTITVFPDGRALIQGTTDIALARSLYARFIGS